MSRQHLAQLLEVKIKADDDANARKSKYEAAVGAYLAATGGDVPADRSSDKVLIVDPTLQTERVVERTIGMSPNEKKYMVVRLAGQAGNEAAVLQEIYRCVGAGYIVCFPDNDDTYAVGTRANLTASDLKSLKIPENFKGHMQRLQAFSDWVADPQKGKSLDQVNFADETKPRGWIGWALRAGRDGVLYDSKAREEDTAKLIAAFEAGKAQRLHSDAVRAPADAKAPADVRGNKGDAADPAAAAITKINALADVLSKIPDVEAMKASNTLPAIDEQITAAEKLVAEAAVALTTTLKDHASLVEHQAKVAAAKLDIAAKRAAYDAVLKAKGEAGAKAGDAAQAHKEDAQEDTIKRLLTTGYYPAADDQSHYNAAQALKVYEGESYVDGAGKTVVYAGALALPATTVVKQQLSSALQPFEKMLQDCKAKVDGTYKKPGATTPELATKLPVTFRFLMNIMGTHNTVLEVSIDAKHQITVKNLDSLLSGTAESPWEEEQNVKLITDAIQRVFVPSAASSSSSYSLPKAEVVRAPSPLGQQGSKECIYFSVAEIARHHDATMEMPLTHLETRKLAVVQLMAKAASAKFKDVRKPAESCATEEVWSSNLRIATKEDMETHKAVAPTMQVGDIIYPPVLVKLARAAAAKKAEAAAAAKENVDVLKDFDDTRRTTVMRKAFAEAQTTAKNWIKPEYSNGKSAYLSVTLAMAQKDDPKAAAGTKTDDVTVSNKECKVHLTATFTKTDHTTVSADITLTRAVDDKNPNEVVRRCQTDSPSLVTWAMQCELWAKQSMTERVEAAQVLNAPPLDTRVSLSINDEGSPKTVSASEFGGDAKTMLTVNEAELLRAYFSEGKFTQVHLKDVGVVFHKSGMKEAGAADVREGKLPPDLFQPLPKSELALKNMPDYKTHGKNLVCGLPLIYNDTTHPTGLNATQQAQAILDNARVLVKKGYSKVMVTYSANLDQANELEKLRNNPNWADKLNQVDAKGASIGPRIGGSGQAAVMKELITLLKENKDFQKHIEIAPLPTMKQAGGAGGPCDDIDLQRHLDYVTHALADATRTVAVVALQNQDTQTAGVHVGFGGAKGVAATFKGEDATKHQAQSKTVQTAFDGMFKSNGPDVDAKAAAAPKKP